MLTSNERKRLYEEYKSQEVVFNKSVIAATGLESRHVLIKHGDIQRPCVVYASSLQSAKVFTDLKASVVEAIKETDNAIQLRYAFRRPDRKDLLTFFISCRISGYSPYENHNLNTLYVTYNAQPPHDFIEIVGVLLDVNAKAEKRQEERIVLNPDVMRISGLRSNSIVVKIEGVPRKCIIRDLSFVGVKVLSAGIARFLSDKPVVVRIVFEDSPPMEIPGKIVRSETVVGRKDITALGIQFEEKSIPMTYKMKIYECFKKEKPSSREPA